MLVVATMTDDLGLFDGRWCDCDQDETASRDPDTVLAHDLTCLYSGDPKRKQLKASCTCWVPPVMARGSLTLNEHDEECGFPQQRCGSDEHRLFDHNACGRPMRMRFCGCAGSDYGYTLDRVRDWWVHYDCGWPTKSWFDGSGRPPPAELQGVKPLTFHEYRMVPKSPKRPYAALSDEQRRVNDAAEGTWLCD